MKGEHNTDTSVLQNGEKSQFANHLSTRLAAKVHELQSMNNYRLLFISKPEKKIR